MSNMGSDDSLNEVDESYFNVYSTKTVTSTYKELLEKIKSANSAPQGEAEEEDEIEIIEYENDENASGTSYYGSQAANMGDDSLDYDDSYPSGMVQAYLCTDPAVVGSGINRIFESAGAGSQNRRRGVKRRMPPELIDLADDETENKTYSLDLTEQDELNHEVSVKVLWKSVSVQTFRLRRFQKFTSVFEYFMKEERVPYEQILLKLRGIKITMNDTPDSINLQVCDFIDGGVISSSMASTRNTAPVQKISENDENSIVVKIQDSTKKSHKFSVKKDEGLKIVMIKYAEEIENTVTKMKFFFDGEVVNPDDTPNSLGMDNNDIIDVKHIK